MAALENGTWPFHFTRVTWMVFLMVEFTDKEGSFPRITETILIGLIYEPQPESDFQPQRPNPD
jgi:hypothetical protein